MSQIEAMYAEVEGNVLAFSELYTVFFCKSKTVQK